MRNFVSLFSIIYCLSFLIFRFSLIHQTYICEFLMQVAIAAIWQYRHVFVLWLFGLILQHLLSTTKCYFSHVFLNFFCRSQSLSKTNKKYTSRSLVTAAPESSMIMKVNQLNTPEIWSQSMQCIPEKSQCSSSLINRIPVQDAEQEEDALPRKLFKSPFSSLTWDARLNKEQVRSHAMTMPRPECFRDLWIQKVGVWRVVLSSESSLRNPLRSRCFWCLQFAYGSRHEGAKLFSFDPVPVNVRQASRWEKEDKTSNTDVVAVYMQTSLSADVTRGRGALFACSVVRLQGMNRTA